MTITAIITFIFAVAVFIFAIAILGFLLLIPYLVWQIKRDVAEIKMKIK